jgi:hypothetical protein
MAKPGATGMGLSLVLVHESNTSAMRNDPFFKFVALIVIVGVVIALVAPNQPAAKATHATITASAQPLPAHGVDVGQ